VSFSADQGGLSGFLISVRAGEFDTSEPRVSVENGDSRGKSDVSASFLTSAPAKRKKTELFRFPLTLNPN